MKRSQTTSPLFIVGAPRSGASVLRHTLALHPHIYFPPDSAVLPQFVLQRPHSPLRRREVSDLLEAVLDDTRHRGQRWEGPPPRPGALMRAMARRTDHPTGAMLLDTLYRTYARRQHASRWGDQTPLYTRHVILLNRLFPQSQFIHVIRDGRDVALSLLVGDERPQEGAPLSAVELYAAARVWRETVRSAQRAGRRLGRDRYFEIYYEDLVRVPNVELRQLCHFLGEPFLPQLVEQPRLVNDWLLGENHFRPFTGDPQPATVEQWRERMAPEDVRLFQLVAGATLRRAGYQRVEGSPPTLVERVRVKLLAGRWRAARSRRRLLRALAPLFTRLK